MLPFKIHFSLKYRIQNRISFKYRIRKHFSLKYRIRTFFTFWILQRGVIKYRIRNRYFFQLLDLDQHSSEISDPLPHLYEISEPYFWKYLNLNAFKCWIRNRITLNYVLPTSISLGDRIHNHYEYRIRIRISFKKRSQIAFLSNVGSGSALFRRVAFDLFDTLLLSYVEQSRAEDDNDEDFDRYLAPLVRYKEQKITTKCPRNSAKLDMLFWKR